MGTQDFVLVNVTSLLPIEDHSKKRSVNIGNKIQAEGVWSKPIVVEKNHMLVLDGHHRFSFAKREGFQFIPVVLVDYQNIEIRSLRKDYVFTKEDVVRKALSGDIFPYKTVKHDFEFKLPKINIDIKELA